MCKRVREQSHRIIILAVDSEVSKVGWEEVYLVVEIMSQNEMCKRYWKGTHRKCTPNCEVPECSRQVGNMLLSVSINK